MSSNIKNINKIKMLNEFENQLTEIFSKYEEKTISFNESVSLINTVKIIWDISRMDIKNIGNDSNKLKMLLLDKGVKVHTPDWYTDQYGEGKLIESTKRNFNLRFKCISDGDLQLTLRGLDFSKLDNIRKPVLINYTKLTINDEVLFNKDNLIWHDDPFYYEDKCSDGNIITVAVEFETIFDYFPQLDSYLTKIKEVNFDSVQDNIKKYIKREKNRIQQEMLHEEDDDLRNLGEDELLNNYKTKISNLAKNINKKTNLAMFGSCVSIDPFRSFYNNYKMDFNKVYEHQRSTFISLMNPKIDVNENELVYLLDTKDKNIVTNDIKKDFNKDALGHFKGIDYLIINLVHDARWGILQYEDTYITNSEYIMNTDFYKNNEEKLRPMSMAEDEEEYFVLYKESVDKFFAFMKENHPNIKIILQKIEFVYNCVYRDGTRRVREDFREHANILNPAIKKLENYIENNYDVDIIAFPKNMTADEENIWGLYSTHYSKIYYKYFFDEVKLIKLEEELINLEADLNFLNMDD